MARGGHIFIHRNQAVKMVGNFLRDDLFFVACLRDSDMVKWDILDVLSCAVCHSVFLLDDQAHQAQDTDTFCFPECEDRLLTPNTVKFLCDSEQRRISFPKKCKPTRGLRQEVDPVRPFGSSVGCTQEDQTDHTRVQDSPIGFLWSVGCFNQTQLN